MPLAVSSNAREMQPFCGVRPGAYRSRETRRMRAKNKNKHPRSEAREHMGPRTHVPAGISLSVDYFPYPLIAHRPSLCRGESRWVGRVSP